MGKIIKFEDYLKNRPTKGKKPEELDQTAVLSIEWLDSEKTSSTYDTIGDHCKTKMGRIVLAEALFKIAEDILYGEDPSIIHEMLETMQESLRE